MENLKKKMYMVETVQLFRHRYVVETYEPSDAEDEVHYNMDNNEFKEFSQKHLSEEIVSVREIEQTDYLRIFDEDNSYLRTWANEQKLEMVNKVNYDWE